VLVNREDLEAASEPAAKIAWRDGALNRLMTEAELRATFGDVLVRRADDWPPLRAKLLC
jgi:hypothetical protein